MTIDFKNIEPQRIPNFKGGKGEAIMQMYVDSLNRIMRGVLQPGSSIGLHTHDTSSEVIFVVSGRGSVIENGQTLSIEAGQCHYCPKGGTHSLVNSGSEDLVFLAVVPQQ